ncbi:T9SS type A sorting domain-containing protein [Chryseolinea lacunae]|uniref:T9SS type A sorting domain-containing protein n=1 Tax=Chryseolinea lacunae TaxID=2801331 RepID=A0ABS1KWD3_9BACT|nr:T9SS type A sorting domain-containing protein [Chryseolinea lacunae]MBL0743770.1 T9SS type A sorting domain-containing protein [Chryseolinea lacunae]
MKIKTEHTISQSFTRWAFALKGALFSLLLLLWLAASANAQFQTFPLPTKAKVASPVKRSNPAARPQALGPKSLPFWDDFSFTSVDNPFDTTSNIPRDTLWFVIDTVAQTTWINSGLGLNPPSANVATFDGLDGNHQKYSEQLVNNGTRDSLTSRPLKLGEPSVSIAERSTVFLSFFFQWAGNGEPPDATDYLRVEFKNNVGVWKPAMTIYPNSTRQASVFYDTLLQVVGDEFFHDNFQFRFRNYGRLSGPYDTWNIDYVYLNKNRNDNDISFPDQTIAGPLSGMFGTYRSIPYHTFKVLKSVTQPKFEIYNLRLGVPEVLSYAVRGTMTNYKDGVITKSTYDTIKTPINDNNTNNIGPLERKTVTVKNLPDPNNTAHFDPDADSVRVKLNAYLYTGDTFDPIFGGFASDYDLNYVPIDFRANDTTSVTYFLKDFYAYDDGVAEYAAGLTQAGNRAAVRFDLVTEDPDTLVGFDIYVPDYGLVSNLTTDFTVYVDNAGLPGDVLYTIPSFTVQRTLVNQFQRVRIVQPKVVRDAFHIGWKAPVGGTLKVGLDYSSDQQDKISVNTNGSWLPSDLTGTLMIRPVMGSGNITGIEDELKALSVYPNPSSGEFYISGPFDRLTVLNITGQTIPHQQQVVDGGHKISLHTAAGLYVLKIQKGNSFVTKKIVVR